LKQYKANFDFTPASEAELKGLEDKPSGYIAGWASTPDVDFYGHIVEGGAFEASIKDRGLKGARGIKLLIGHDHNKVAGEIVVLEYRGRRLWIEAQLNLNISYVKDYHEAIKSAGGLGFSVGFFMGDYDIEKNTGIVKIKNGDLFEVSVVAFGANEKAKMSFYKSIEALDNLDPSITSMEEFEQTLLQLGIANKLLTKSIVFMIKANIGLFTSKKIENPLPIVEETKIDNSAIVEKLQNLDALVRKNIDTKHTTEDKA
jgi:HK97 family phage prohead protease